MYYWGGKNANNFASRDTFVEGVKYSKVLIMFYAKSTISYQSS